MHLGGKSIVRTTALIALFGNPSIGAPLVFDVRLSLEVLHDNLTVTIRNSPNEPIQIPTPLVEWRPGVGGIELKIWGKDGREVAQCVQIDYPGEFQKQTELKPAARMEKSFTFDDIKKNHCLSAGKYFAQAILHNEIDGKVIADEVASNPVVVEFK